MQSPDDISTNSFADKITNTKNSHGPPRSSNVAKDYIWEKRHINPQSIYGNIITTTNHYDDQHLPRIYQHSSKNGLHDQMRSNYLDDEDYVYKPQFRQRY